MKRSESRASKVSTDGRDSFQNSFPGIPDSKWHEFLEKEEIDLFVLGLREEIMQKCLEMCFDNYLEKQSVAFTVHCTYMAWCKVLNVYCMMRDLHDIDGPNEKTSWEPDPEPEPSVADSWGSQCIMPLVPEPTPKFKKEPEKEVCTSSIPKVCSLESVESSSFVSDLFNVREGEYFFSPRVFSLSSPSVMNSVFSSDFCISVGGSVTVQKNLNGMQDPCHPSTRRGENTKK